MSENDKRTYREKLLDGRWQIARLRILERDGFRCQACGASGEAGATLHVHHRWYERDKEPWEAPPEALVTLCDECHTQESESRDYWNGEVDHEIRKRFLVNDLYHVQMAIGVLPECPVEVGNSAIAQVAYSKDLWMEWRRRILRHTMGEFAPED